MTTTRLLSSLFLLPLALVLHAQEVIQINNAQLSAMFEERESLLMRPLREEEKKELVRSAVYDEILLKEAVELNLHLVDQEVRERLISLMAFSFEPEADNPTEADLRAYFEEHREDFDLPPRYTFDHIFLEPGSKLDPETVKISDDWKGLGDEHWAGKTVTDKPAYEIVLFLGESVAESLKTAPLNSWEGPIPSPIGSHFIRVVNRTEPQPLSFEASRNRVEKVWIERNKAAKFHETLMDLLSKYTLEIPDDFRSALELDSNRP